MWHSTIEIEHSSIGILWEYHKVWHTIIQARWKQNCIGSAYRYLYNSAYDSVYTEARCVWGHAPPGKCFEFIAVRWLQRLFWGPKRHYYSLLLSWHGNKILIHFTFQSPGNCVKERRTQTGQNFV